MTEKYNNLNMRERDTMSGLNIYNTIMYFS